MVMELHETLGRRDFLKLNRLSTQEPFFCIQMTYEQMLGTYSPKMLDPDAPKMKAVPKHRSQVNKYGRCRTYQYCKTRTMMYLGTSFSRELNISKTYSQPQNIYSLHLLCEQVGVGGVHSVQARVSLYFLHCPPTPTPTLPLSYNHN